MARQNKPLTVGKLIAILEQVDDHTLPVYFFANEPGELPGFDDRHKPLTEDCIDLDMTDQVDINLDNT